MQNKAQSIELILFNHKIQNREFAIIAGSINGGGGEYSR